MNLRKGTISFRFASFSTERMNEDVFNAKTTFEEGLPFDLLLKEQEKLNGSINLIDKLKNAEL